MAQAKKSDHHKIASLKGESPACEGNCATYQKSFAHHNQRHHQRDPPVTILVLKGLESAIGRGNFLPLVPILLPSLRPKDVNLGSDALVNIDGPLSVSQPIQVNLQQGQMIPIPDGSTCSLVPYGYCRDRPTKNSYIRSKRSKSGKISSREWLQNNFQQNDSTTLIKNDSRRDVSEVLDDDNNRLNKAMKRNPRKKGKKKGKHPKVFTEREVCIDKESVLERSLQVMPTTKITVNSLSCSTDVSEKNSSHTSISSCLSVQILNEKPEGEEYSYSHIDYIGTPSPMATSNSDEMTEVEPVSSFSEEHVCNECRSNMKGYTEHSSNQTCSSNIAQTNSDEMTEVEPVSSFSEELVCNEYLSNMEDCTEHSSNQTCSSNIAQTDGTVSSTACKNIGVCSNQSSSFDDTSCSYYSGQDTIPVSDLSVDEWGSDNCSSYHSNRVNINSCRKYDDRFSPADRQVDFPHPRTGNFLDAEMPISGKNSEPNENSSVGCDRTGILSVNETCSASKACTTSSQQCIPGKRGRHGRKSASTCSSAHSVHRSGNQTHLGKVGKDGHSVWQRVEKKGAEPCIPNRKPKVSSLESDVYENPVFMKNKPLNLSQMNENDDFFSVNEISSHSDGLSVTCNFDNTPGLHGKLESANLLSNPQRRTKGSPSSSIKHDSNQYSRKVSQFGKPTSTKHAMSFVYQNEEMAKPTGLGCEKQEISDPKSLCRSDKSKSDFYPFEEMEARSGIEEHNILDSGTTLECSHSNANGTTALVGKDHYNTSAREVDSWQQQHRQNVPSEGGNYISYKEDGVFYQYPVNDSIVDMRMDTRNSQFESSRHDNVSGAIMQKWVPVTKKGSSMASRGHPDDPSGTPKDLNLQKGDFNNSIQIANQEFDCGSSFSTVTPISKCSGSTNTTPLTCSKIDAYGGTKFSVTLPLSPKPNVDKDTFNYKANLGTEEVEYNVETDMQKIVQAVSDACEFQHASELFLLPTSSPVAEFERFLCSSSPVISQMHYISQCKPCSSDQSMGSRLCQHQIPNISIRNVWRWYEQPGSYGLEVKVGDQHLKRPVPNQTGFRAYFVPYLSAIQLFGITFSKKQGSCKADKSSSLPPLSALPIFSFLLPQSDKKLPVLTPDCSSSSEGASLSDISLNKIGDNGELLFEYFESDPPQQRRPLYEKVRELVRGDTFSNSKVFGDPSKLDSLNLHDIHPASWFSVAWYPIYRIPDGNFRAAFLTYHSLGTFTHRDAKLTSRSSIDVVSPVVGLQSYNAKGECWFQLNEHESTMSQSEEHLSNRSYILKERLRSLEQTASVMARASVSKNGQKSVNRQPDYEFFLSRSC